VSNFKIKIILSKYAWNLITSNGQKQLQYTKLLASDITYIVITYFMKKYLHLIFNDLCNYLLLLLLSIFYILLYLN